MMIALDENNIDHHGYDADEGSDIDDFYYDGDGDN